jgi:hypothetical protein
VSETQERFSPSELRYVSFKCACGLTLTHDAASSGGIDVQNPPRCPKCGESLKEFAQIIYTYANFYNFCKDKAVSLIAKK